MLAVLLCSLGRGLPCDVTLWLDKSCILVLGVKLGEGRKTRQYLLGLCDILHNVYYAMSNPLIQRDSREKYAFIACVPISFKSNPNPYIHRSWSSDKPHQSDRISAKVLPQDLSLQWSFPALIIVAQSLQVYLQISLSVTAHKEQSSKKKRPCDISPQRTSLTTCEIPPPL